MLPDICRVTTIKVLGVTITNHLSISDHGRDVIFKCSQSLYALKVLSNGMNDEALRHVYRAVVIAKLLYASLAWLAYTTAADRARRGVYSTRSATRTVPGWGPNENATYRQQRRQSLQQPTYQRTRRTQTAASWQDKLSIQSQKSSS